MNMTDLLIGKKIDPKEVLVLRHTPQENELRKAFQFLAIEKPDVFNAYQQTQNVDVEKRMLNAKYIAAFIGHEPGKAMFMGLYSNKGNKPITREEYWQIPTNSELKKFGHDGFSTESPRSSILWFDLELMNEFYPHLKGKMIVNWDGIEKNWHRWASDVTLLIREPEWGMISLNGGGEFGELQNIFVPETPEGLERVLREVRQRLGQSEFRKQLIAAYNGTCAVTGCNAVYALEAAHIRPYSDSGSAASEPCNGLLLRADIHTLFDLNLLRINPQTMIVDLHESLTSTSYSDLHGKPIRQPQQEDLRPKGEFLKERWGK
jgi:hypothetical protein